MNSSDEQSAEYLDGTEKLVHGLLDLIAGQRVDSVSMALMIATIASARALDVSRGDLFAALAALWDTATVNSVVVALRDGLESPS